VLLGTLQSPFDHQDTRQHERRSAYELPELESLIQILPRAVSDQDAEAGALPDGDDSV
jgi:hypothetical protein